MTLHTGYLVLLGIFWIIWPPYPLKYEYKLAFWMLLAVLLYVAMRQHVITFTS